MRKNRLLALAAAITVAAMGLACVRTRAPYSRVVYTGGYQNTVNVTVVNMSPQTICYVYISNVARETWGPDQLGATEVIPVGRARPFALPAGQWDLRADNCNHQPIGVLRGAWITTNSTLTVN